MTPTKSMLNTIAYMAKSFNRPGWHLSGFKELRGAYINWGVKIEGKWFAAMHYSNTPILTVVSEHETTEQEIISEGNIYPVMMYGSDNTSYVIRFKTEQERNVFMTSDDMWDCNSTHPIPLYYNS